MQAQKTALVCMADSFYRVGLAGVLKEAGYSVSLVGQPNEIDRDVHKRSGYLILGESDISIIDVALNCIERIEPEATAVIVNMIKPFEVNKLKSLGVSAVLSADMKPDALVRSLALLPEHWILNTGIVIPDGVVGFMQLTDREWQTVAMLAQGSSVKEIAGFMGLSVKTVEAHKFNLMKKLDIHNKAQLVIWFTQNKNLWQANPNGSL